MKNNFKSEAKSKKGSVHLDGFTWKALPFKNAFGIVETKGSAQGWLGQLTTTPPTPAYRLWTAPTFKSTPAPAPPTPLPKLLKKHVVLFLHLTIAGARWQPKVLHRHTRLLRKGLLQLLNQNTPCDVLLGCQPFRFPPSAIQVVKIVKQVSSHHHVDRVTVGIDTTSALQRKEIWELMQKPTSSQTIEKAFRGAGFRVHVKHGVYVPTPGPTLAPTSASPTMYPTKGPTKYPTLPTKAPTAFPSKFPTFHPTRGPTNSPAPSACPTYLPTVAPTKPAVRFLRVVFTLKVAGRFNTGEANLLHRLQKALADNLRVDVGATNLTRTSKAVKGGLTQLLLVGVY
jgi:hypothetical protein